MEHLLSPYEQENAGKVQTNFSRLPLYVYKKILEYKIGKRLETIKNKRGVMTKKKFEDLLYELTMHSINSYSMPKGKRKIMMIVGGSKTGKTLSALHLRYKLGANTICVFTNKKPKKTEVEGRDYHFFNIFPNIDDTLFFIKSRNSYVYFALRIQVWSDCSVCVGNDWIINYINQHHKGQYDIYKVMLKSEYRNRIKRGYNQIDKNKEKYERGAYGITSEDNCYRIINNDSTKKELFRQIEEVYNQIKNL